MKKKKRRAQSGTNISDIKNSETSDWVAVVQSKQSSLGSEVVTEASKTSEFEDRNVEASVCRPCITLDSSASVESRMESATDVLRESSPRNARRPHLQRQSSVEMQQAVDVQRPLTSDRKKSTSLCIPVETPAGFTSLMDTESHTTIEVTLEDDSESRSPETETKAKKSAHSFGGLSTDTNTGTWKNPAVEDNDDEEEISEAEPKILPLEAPSYSRIASKPKPAVLDDDELPEPPAVIEGKCSLRETVVFVEENDSEDSIEKDEEGFETAITRKHRRERKNSKRLSQNYEDFNNNKEENDGKEENLKQPESVDKIEPRSSAIDLPMTESSEEPKILPLEAPSYSRIASKPKPAVLNDEKLPEPPGVIEGKCSIRETVVFVEEKQNDDLCEKDEEGFETAITRKHKRERKNSKRLSRGDEKVSSMNSAIDIVEIEASKELQNADRISSTSNLEKKHWNNIANDTFWVNKHLFDDAEENYFLKMKRNIKISDVEKDDNNDGNDDDDDNNEKKENNDDHDMFDSEHGVDDNDDDNEDYGSNLECSDYNWSDESTFLKPNIPILKPLTFKMISPSHPSIPLEDSVSQTAQSLTNAIQQHVSLKAEAESLSEEQNTSLQVAISPFLLSLSDYIYQFLPLIPNFQIFYRFISMIYYF